MTIWSTSVQETVSLFRDGLLAILPVADRGRISWRNENNYDDWDVIAMALYESFVAMNVFHDVKCEGWPAPQDYDMRRGSYDQTNTYVIDAAQPELAVLVCLKTGEDPFDTCVLARLDESFCVKDELRVPLASTRLRAISGISLSRVVDTLSVRL